MGDRHAPKTAGLAMTISDLMVLQSPIKDKPVFKVYLFGSQSRNEATKHSDIDLPVELDYSQHIGFQFAKMQKDLEKLLKKKWT